MHITCKNCGATTSIEKNLELVHFGCTECKTLFVFKNNDFKQIQKSEYAPINPMLKIGQKGVIEGVDYEVVGVIIKKVYSIHYWREYVLLSNDGNYKYLSESDGHWILLEEISEVFDVSSRRRSINYHEINYDLYEYTDAEIVGAYGFFDADLPTGKIKVAEYINPPSMISIEVIDGKQFAFLGRHFSKSELKKAFPGTALPSRSGIGIVQPFPFHIANTAIVFCCFAILILVSHLLLDRGRIEKSILSKEFAFSEFDNKDFVSDSFELNGASAPLTITIESQINNSWANAQLVLVNEKTNEQEYASKDLEYYHGYTEGESWTEGAQGDKFYFCGVSEGKYHLIITPQKQPDDFANNSLKINIVWNEPSLWNFTISALIMIIIIAILFFGRKIFEAHRWSESDYSE